MLQGHTWDAEREHLIENLRGLLSASKTEPSILYVQMEIAHRRPRYVVISPVKDEERYIERTLESMVNQTLRPALWIIVDDGSSDRTPEIVQRYSERSGLHPS